VKELSDLDEWEKRWEKRRKDNLKKILKLAKKPCPVEYVKFVHVIYIELGLGYFQNAKRGIYSKELDSLTAVGKLKLEEKMVKISTR
jgi:preprotein translocase subunit Sss1